MPALFVERSSQKCFIFVGARAVTTTYDVNFAFVVFLSMFYVLDVDYPPEMVVALSTMHRLVFMNNRVSETQIENYNSIWKEISVYIH